jgi:hypothetical protein
MKKEKERERKRRKKSKNKEVRAAFEKEGRESALFSQIDSAQ